MSVVRLPYSPLLNRNICKNYLIPAYHRILDVSVCGQLTCLFSSQIFRLRRKILKELYPRNYTWGTSSAPGPDINDTILDFEPEHDAIME